MIRTLGKTPKCHGPVVSLQHVSRHLKTSASFCIIHIHKPYTIGTQHGYCFVSYIYANHHRIIVPPRSSHVSFCIIQYHTTPLLYNPIPRQPGTVLYHYVSYTTTWHMSSIGPYRYCSVSYYIAIIHTYRIPPRYCPVLLCIILCAQQPYDTLCTTHTYYVSYIYAITR